MLFEVVCMRLKPRSYLHVAFEEIFCQLRATTKKLPTESFCYVDYIGRHFLNWLPYSQSFMKTYEKCLWQSPPLHIYAKQVAENCSGPFVNCRIKTLAFSRQYEKKEDLKL